MSALGRHSSASVSRRVYDRAMRDRAAIAGLSVLLLTGCGGSSATPSGPTSTSTPSAAPTPVGLTPFPSPAPAACSFSAAWTPAGDLFFDFEPSVVDLNRSEPIVVRVKTTSGDRVEFVPNGGAPIPLTRFGPGLFCGSIPFDGITRVYNASVPHHVFAGFVDVYSGSLRLLRFNGFISVKEPGIPSTAVTRIADDVQVSAHLLNWYNPNQLQDAVDVRVATQTLYRYFADEYDFVNVVFWPGRSANRFHSTVQNAVVGNGTTVFNNSAQYGSTRLLGYNVFPLPSLFDMGETGASHEIGHQWMSFLRLPQAPAFASGSPHWPPSSLANAVMGASILGSNVGGQFNFTVTGSGGTATMTAAAQGREFTDLDLYLMGLAPPSEVGTHWVFTNASQQICDRCSGPAVPITVADVIAVHGARQPAYPQAQSSFRVATILVSAYRPLSQTEMDFFEVMAARGEATAPLSFSAGFTNGTTLPFALATRSRGSLNTRLGTRR